MRALCPLVLVLAACGSTPFTPPNLRDQCAVTSPAPSPDELGVVGLPTTLKLRRGVVCPAGLALSARVSVLDPRSDPVPLPDGDTVQITERDDLYVTAQVTFTPTEPGLHTVTARFEPNLGVVQEQLAVGLDRSSVQPTLRLPPSAGLERCRHLDVSEGGRVLCLAPYVAILDGTGALLEELSDAGHASRSGASLWVHHHGTTLSRWVELAGGFTKSPAAEEPLSGDTVLLPTPADVVLLVDGKTMTYVGLGDGGFVTNVTPMLSTRALQSGWRRGDRVVLMGNSQQCDHMLGPGRPTCGLSSSFSDVVGSEPDRAWGLAVTALARLAVRSHTPEAEHDLLIHFDTCDFCTPPVVWRVARKNFHAWDFGPWLVHPTHREVHVPTLRGGAVVADRWPAGKPVLSVTSRWLARGDDAGVELYPR